MAGEIAKVMDVPTVSLAPRREIALQLAESVPGAAMTVQSLLRCDPEHPFSEVGLVVVDECHHITDHGVWLHALKLFPNALFLGLTGTPVPEMASVFHQRVLAANYQELVRAGHLCDVEMFQPPGWFDDGVAADPVGSYIKHGNDGQAFCFAPTVDKSKEWRDAFVFAGIPAEHIDGTTSKTDRDRVISRFRHGDTQVLCNVDITTEGFDVPEASVVILGRKFLSLTAYLQATARAARVVGDKCTFRCIDLTGCTHEHGSPVADRDFTPDFETKNKGKVPPLRQCLQCGYIMDAGLMTCERCAYQFPEPDPRIIKQHQEELRQANTESTTLSEREQNFRDLLSKALERGYAPYWCEREFRKVYWDKPPWHVATNQQQREILRLNQKKHGHRKGYAMTMRLFKR